LIVIDAYDLKIPVLAFKVLPQSAEEKQHRNSIVQTRKAESKMALSFLFHLLI